MAAVYKSLAKANGHTDGAKNETPKPKQRVLILSSRGVTMRFVNSVGFS